MVSLSANGADTATDIVWAILSTDNIEPGKGDSRGELLAFDARNVKDLLWSEPIGLTPHWAPPTIAEGKVFVSNLNGEVMAYVLGPNPNDTNWTRYQPKLAFERCRTCHSEAQPEEFFRRQSLLKYYINEASVFALPAYTLRQLPVPGGLSKGLVLEGNGTATYQAEPSASNPAKFCVEAETNNGRVERISAGSQREGNQDYGPAHRGCRVDSCNGSRIEGSGKKSVPAPVSFSLPWASYDVVKTGDRACSPDTPSRREAARRLRSRGTMRRCDLEAQNLPRHGSSLQNRFQR
jgi:hypothetical protein